MNSFSTNFGTQRDDIRRFGGATHGVYALQTIGSMPVRRLPGQTIPVSDTAHGLCPDPGEDGESARVPRRLRPDVYTHETKVTHSGSSSVYTGEGEALAAVGSRELIITQDVCMSYSRRKGSLWLD